MSDSNSEQKREEVAVRNKYRGARCRKWGRWVSEARVSGKKQRLWLGSYTTPEAAAVAYDVATYCLRGESSLGKLNFPQRLPDTLQPDMSPRSIKRAALDAANEMDAMMIEILSSQLPAADQDVNNAEENNGAQGIGNEIGEDGSGGGAGNSMNWEMNETGSDEGQAFSISIDDLLS